MSKTLLKVNGVYIQDPQTYEVSIYDLDSEEGSGRTQDGNMVRDRKAVKRKINCTFPPLHQNEISELLNAVTPMFFNFTYLDPQYGQRTIGAYVGDRTTPVYAFDEIKKEWLWRGLSMNFIER